MSSFLVDESLQKKLPIKRLQNHNWACLFNGARKCILRDVFGILA